MNQLEKFISKIKHMYKLIIGVCVLAAACIVMCISCFQYYNHLQQILKEETGEYMREIAKQMSGNIQKIINDNFSVLGTIASDLSTFHIDSYDSMYGIINNYKDYWHYQKIILIDADGIAHDATGRTETLDKDTYLQDVVVGRIPVISTAQLIDGKECIVFAIPIDDITVDGVQMLALAGCYTLDTFDTTLHMEAFNGKGYAHIIDKDGTVVIRSSSPNAMEAGYNILNTLASADIRDGKTIEDIKRGIASGVSAQTEFSLGDTHEYMTYTPVGLQDWNLLTFVPVTAVSKHSIAFLKVTLLLCSFIALTFTMLFLALFIITYRNRRRLENIAYVDPVTGGHTIGRFYELVQKRLGSSNKSPYAMIYMNIEKFKILNEQFGKENSDKILTSIVNGIGADLKDGEYIGRLYADNFCIFVNYEGGETLLQRFTTWEKNCMEYQENNGFLKIPLVAEFGVFTIDDVAIPVPNMIDRAKLSLTAKTCESKGKMRYAFYDEKLRHALLREKRLEDMMEDALANREFEVYLQPKYNTQTEQIGGAEALVRWHSASEGMIYPDEFIPLFEKNRFVIQIDLFVFEEVCRMIQRWRQDGKPLIRISVNCARVHLKSADFLNNYSRIAQMYDLPQDAVELELSENDVFEDVEYLSEVIRKIHAAGFGCSMDDFGSGHSSLNLIRDIPVDTIKLDKTFFHTTSGDMERTESVIGSIIAMSKALHMHTVAEGVEEREQVEMLKRLSCDLIQGYYFARPMPIADFERIAFVKNK
ncbi:MAG: EAL domain-containing protein [Clostridium sp.]